jgi:hypothetical protein
MEIQPNNPPSNKLSSGLTDADVLAAISQSGYPLQTTVAKLLRTHFDFLQEEWSYVDKDTKEIRTIDVLAENLLWDITQEQPRVRPTLALLVECKKSDLPFVFFTSPNKTWGYQFPLLAGLFKDTVTLATDDESHSWEFPILHALELDSHPFVAKEPEISTAFTKCVRKGSDIELLGTEPFHGLVLPLIKAMHHFRAAESPPKTAWYFDCHLVIGLGVLDAPMIGARVSERSRDLTLLPWVRVVRHQTDENVDFRHRTHLYAIDVVHKDFLEEYIDNHVLPFAKDFSKLVVKHQQVLASGEGFVSGLGKDCSHNIEQRMEPRKTGRRVSGFKMVGKNILRVLTGR